MTPSRGGLAECTLLGSLPLFPSDPCHLWGSEDGEADVFLFVAAVENVAVPYGYLCERNPLTMSVILNSNKHLTFYYEVILHRNRSNIQFLITDTDTDSYTLKWTFSTASINNTWNITFCFDLKTPKVR